MKLSSVFYIFLVIISYACAGNILFLVPFNGPSHWLFLSHFIRELLNRGHHVTAITGIKYTYSVNSNYTEILIDPPYDFSTFVSNDDVFETKYTSPFSSVKWLYTLGLDNSEYGLKNLNVQRLIQSENEHHFDLVISEQFYQETWLMFAHKFNAPIVTISSMGYSDYMDYANGLVTPWAYVPHLLLNFSDKMTFWQRVENVLLSLYDKYLRLTFYMPENNKLAEKYFGSALKSQGPLPRVEDMEKKIDVMLVNFNHAISKPRPSMPNQINIGGAHIKPKPKLLPTEIQKFIDEAENGVIYMSLGAYVKSASMPVEKMQEFLNAFGQLKQRVLWKFESDNLPELPKNVMMKKWMPQADILAHKNVRLFITHGGMFGTTEGTYNGLPMLFIPFYGDQHRNALKAEAAGTALTLRFAEINADTLKSKLNELLQNKKYYEKAQDVSRVFKDSPIHPMDSAIFYVEYVMRHKGAKYLKSSAIELSWYENLLLDIVGLCFSIVILTILLIFLLVKLIKKALSQTKDLKLKHS
uniref:CSON000634 protein n=1 Tax=Culicoides sonorensis TaxID=179676 RepID=A0A336LTZ6_CULSO